MIDDFTGEEIENGGWEVRAMGRSSSEALFHFQSLTELVAAILGQPHIFGLSSLDYVRGQLERQYGITYELPDTSVYVQVEIINNGGRRYTYRDPSGQLAEGMLVEIPTVYGTTIGKVVALGHGGYSGEIKDVAAVLRKADL